MLLYNCIASSRASSYEPNLLSYRAVYLTPQFNVKAEMNHAVSNLTEYSLNPGK